VFAVEVDAIKDIDEYEDRIHGIRNKYFSVLETELLISGIMSVTVVLKDGYRDYMDNKEAVNMITRRLKRLLP
jgi:hypothetical protein